LASPLIYSPSVDLKQPDYTIPVQGYPG